MRKLLPTPPRNDRQTRRKQHKHQCNEKGRRSLLHGEPNGGLPFMLYSFLASVFKSHQSARVLCCISEMSPLAWKNWFSEKNVFPNFSARKKPVKMQKHRTFVRCFLCWIFHQHILVRVARLELTTPWPPVFCFFEQFKNQKKGCKIGNNWGVWNSNILFPFRIF